MSAAIEFDRLARIPAPGDNVAIATRRVESGTTVAYEGRRFSLGHTVLEGHRFVLDPVGAGEALLSWGLPFGIAVRDLGPGEYACNEKILHALAGRHVDFELPEQANFEDHLERFDLDLRRFEPGEQVAAVPVPGSFRGYRRRGGRGVGTRNFVVVLATTSPASGFVRTVAEMLAPALAEHPAIDAVVPVTHTEGGAGGRPNNLDYVLRTLAGFMVHPNVGAVLAVDHDGGGFSNHTLEAFMREHGYPLDAVAHAFWRVETDFKSAVRAAAAQVRSWLPEVGAARRTEEPLAGLKLALQCGGSDAFSGVSGNALAGWLAKTLIRHGGSANLAETDELIGAEPYVLSNVRDAETAQAFLDKIEHFKRYAAHHGTSAEGNPSGGNNYRGLYNIALKSIGAARKKDPEVRLDYVIDYAQPMRESGYYFMDSPGNDLESIAGQVGAGSNLILFITGNGSITNFPFVPALKFVTTTGRFELLADEMDVNAGRYNDGLAMDELGAETFDLALAVASGAPSKGELAGHSQVSVWRDWPQIDGRQLQSIRSRAKPTGVPIAVRAGEPADIRYAAYRTERGPAIEQVGLVMPTSLCSGQPARVIARHLNAASAAGSGSAPPALQRYVALVHTEGCGSNNTAPIFLQTLLGHLEHRSVRHAVLLEHGCEQTHNDTVRQYLEHRGLDGNRFGWASVQLDGGLARVRDRVASIFGELSAASGPIVGREDAGPRGLSVALTATGSIGSGAAVLLATLARRLVCAGATVVVPQSASLLESEPFRTVLLQDPDRIGASLGYGQVADRTGLHVMETPTRDQTESLTGLGATGVDLMLCHAGQAPMQAHPMIPLMQVSANPVVIERFGPDLDLTLDLSPGADEAGAGDGLARLERLIGEVASGRYAPKLYARGVTEFQLTRGLLGVSM